MFTWKNKKLQGHVAYSFCYFQVLIVSLLVVAQPSLEDQSWHSSTKHMEVVMLQCDHSLVK